jgi:hypothetical protein
MRLSKYLEGAFRYSNNEKIRKRIGKPIASSSMTASRHLIALLKSHIDGDDEHFCPSQCKLPRMRRVRATENLLRSYVISWMRRALGAKSEAKKPVPLAQPKGELASLVSVSYSDTRLSSMVVPLELEERLKRVLIEQQPAPKSGHRTA